MSLKGKFMKKYKTPFLQLYCRLDKSLVCHSGPFSVNTDGLPDPVIIKKVDVQIKNEPEYSNYLILVPEYGFAWVNESDLDI